MTVCNFFSQPVNKVEPTTEPVVEPLNQPVRKTEIKHPLQNK